MLRLPLTVSSYLAADSHCRPVGPARSPAVWSWRRADSQDLGLGSGGQTPPDRKRRRRPTQPCRGGGRGDGARGLLGASPAAASAAQTERPPGRRGARSGCGSRDGRVLREPASMLAAPSLSIVKKVKAATTAAAHWLCAHEAHNGGQGQSPYHTNRGAMCGLA